MKNNLKIIVFTLSMMLSMLGIGICIDSLINPTITKIDFALFLLGWVYIILITIVTHPDKK